jgi:membrane fusion protein, multidrug efflux system
MATISRAAPALGTLALGLALTACGHRSPPPSTDVATAQPPVTIVTAAVERSGGAGTVAVPGTVQARQRAALAARIPASVVSLPFREGERVRAGAVVARLDDAALRSGLAAAEAAATAADADRARMEALLKKGAATPRECEESRARAAGAAAAVASARDGLAYAALRAPFDGTVSSRPVNVGDVASPGATLIEIEGDGGLEVRATVDADKVGLLRKGASLLAVVDGHEPLAATVSVVSAAADAATHRFEVRADLPRAPGLRSGLFARLLVPAAVGEPQLSVPRAAVFERGGLTGTFVVAEGTARLRWVAVGSTTGERTELRAGVEAGERVALRPADLVDGQRVVDAAAGMR